MDTNDPNYSKEIKCCMCGKIRVFDTPQDVREIIFCSQECHNDWLNIKEKD